MNLPRPAAARPWAYVKVAEGCDRSCGFCAIPTFRGPQRSRTAASILDEVDALDAREVVLVAQDLASYGRDQGKGERAIVPLIEAVADLVDRVRLLYLYPSDLTDRLVATICATGVPYFDLSLQHVSPPLMRRMRRWGDSEHFLERIAHIRCVSLDGEVAPGLVAERLHELGEIQDRITANRRDALIGRTVTVLVDEPEVGRTHREAPEIDGIVIVPSTLPIGQFADVTVTGALGPDLVAA